ncbi:MAG: VIT1/CCC1 transporter family protein [Desulfovibrio sp.]|nr:VIT1/CCC1 transporter family protein [Desulfovibrio sp.]
MARCRYGEKNSDPARRAYIAAVILGLNDALVELTGALAGFTVSLGDSRTIALAGLTTGVAATLSMASAEYLAEKSRRDLRIALKASLSTGLAYLLTTTVLLAPYLFIKDPVRALVITVSLAALATAGYSWIVSELQCRDFRK